MADRKNQVTLMIITDAAKNPISLKFSMVLYRVLCVSGVLLVAAIIIGAITYSQLLSHSFERDRLIEENGRLKEYNAKVIQLENDLKTNRIMLRKMTELAGIDLSDFGMAELVELDTVPHPLVSESYDLIPVPDSIPHPIPSGLPVSGWISRSFRPDDDNPKIRHFGIDIAVGIGKPVVATADGIVKFADWDSTFGWTVVLEHENGLETVYGHNDTLLIAVGDRKLYGESIAISGNTGISTAPHLHYEIRKDGKPVDPEEYFFQEQ